MQLDLNSRTRSKGLSCGAVIPEGRQNHASFEFGS